MNTNIIKLKFIANPLIFLLISFSTISAQAEIDLSQATQGPSQRMPTKVNLTKLSLNLKNEVAQVWYHLLSKEYKVIIKFKNTPNETYLKAISQKFSRVKFEAVIGNIVTARLSGSVALMLSALNNITAIQSAEYFASQNNTRRDLQPVNPTSNVDLALLPKYADFSKLTGPIYSDFARVDYSVIRYVALIQLNQPLSATAKKYLQSYDVVLKSTTNPSVIKASFTLNGVVATSALREVRSIVVP